MKTIFQPSPWSLAGLVLLILLPVLTLPFPAHSEEARHTNTLGMTFIRIEPGIFTMGSPVSEPRRGKDAHQHRETISSAFYLQETEVTLAQWRAVIRVFWHDGIKYIKRLNAKALGAYRLPTQAEWEYACRAGSWYKHAASLCSANKTYAHPGARFKTTGFRLVLEAD